MAAVGRRLVFLEDREEIVKLRARAITSKQCSNVRNKAHCPEVFLLAASSMLTEQAILHLDTELLRELHDQLPWALGQRFGTLSKDAQENLARQDPQIGEHLDIIRRKEMLQLALAKMKRLQYRKGTGFDEEP
jgi:dynamin-like GTPase MGM1, mitochondrial